MCDNKRKGSKPGRRWSALVWLSLVTAWSCAGTEPGTPEVLQPEEIVTSDLASGSDFTESDSVEAVQGCVLDTFDADLLQWLEARIEGYPGIDTETYVAPDAEALDAFRTALALVVTGDYCGAAAIAPAAGYELVLLTDMKEAGGGVHLLQPEAGTNDGRGVYLVRPDAVRDLVLEAPHPVYDLRSAQVAARIFLISGARALAVAGAHRCANSAAAGCDGTTKVCNDGEWGPYRESDMAHADQSFFQEFHQVLSTEAPDTVTVQVHGIASGDDDPEFSVSDGTKIDLPDQAHPPNLLAADLEARLAAAGSAKPGNSCNREGDKNFYCGTSNMQGRFSNGVAPEAICTTAADIGTGAFLHLELSKELRHPGGILGPEMVIDAVLEVIPES